MPNTTTRSIWTSGCSNLLLVAIASRSQNLICASRNGQTKLKLKAGKKLPSSRSKSRWQLLSANLKRIPARRPGALTQLNQSQKHIPFDDYHLSRSDSGSTEKGSAGRPARVYLWPGYRHLRRSIQGDQEPGERISWQGH